MTADTTVTHAIKIAVIGGGSTYTPELIEGILQSALPVREVVLVDPDLWKLEIVGGLAQRMAAQAERPLTVNLTDARGPALADADVVITQFRIGGQAARIHDERLPLSHGLVGQETTGPGGFAKALRTIPVALEISRELTTLAPNAWLVNFTNPSGVISEALRLHGGARFVGLCNYPLTLQMNAARALGVEAGRVTLDYFGLNHLSWTRVRVDGEDRTDALIDIMLSRAEHRELSGYAFDPARLRALGLIPSGYLRYFYDTAKMVEELRKAPQTRGERVREVEERLLACYAESTLCRKPPELQQRGGAWYSTAAIRLIEDLWREDGGTHVLNVPNTGMLPFLSGGQIVEAPARVSTRGIAGLPSVFQRGEGYAIGDHPIPAEVVALIRRVKDYELLTVQAAISGRRDDAIHALAAHPLLDGRHAEIPTLVDELLAAHRAYLPQFA